MTKEQKAYKNLVLMVQLAATAKAEPWSNKVDITNPREWGPLPIDQLRKLITPENLEKLDTLIASGVTPVVYCTVTEKFGILKPLPQLSPHALLKILHKFCAEIPIEVPWTETMLAVLL